MNQELWTQSKLITLIQLYESKPFLWNPNDRGYKNKLKRKEAWDEISKEMGMDVQEIKRKLDSLLAQYRREKKLDTTGGLSKKHKPWWGLTHLSFLADTKTARSTFIRDVSEQRKCNENEKQELTEMTSAQSSGKSFSQRNITLHTPSTSASFSTKKLGAKRNGSDEPYIIMKNCYEGLRKAIERDEHSVYGENVAEILRKIKDPRRLCILKNKINNLLFQYELQEYEDTNTENPNTEQNQTEEEELVSHYLEPEIKVHVDSS